MLINRSHHKIVVWYNPKKYSYYYKAVTGFYANYDVGYKNQYGHTVILVIDLEYYSARPKLIKRLLRNLISFLNKIDRKI